MNFRDLNYIVTVAELCHFGKAADACFVSQPTLSAQVKKLEGELGVVIFERDNKRVLVTEVGQQIVAQAKNVLREMQEIKTLANASKDPFSGQLKLGIIPTVAPYLLPHIMPLLRKKLPDLYLLLLEEQTEHILAKVNSGDLDAIILALPIEHERLTMHPLFKEDFLLALPKGHPLTKKKRVKLDDLNDQSLLLLEEGHCLREQALDACQLTSAQEYAGFRATSLETLRHMVTEGIGITLLPELSVLKPVSQNARLEIRPFTKPIPSRQIVMLWRRKSVRHEVCKKIADIITEKMKALNHRP